MIELKLPYALDANDRMVSAEVVPRGAACGCRCPECLAPLISKQGNVIRWHFAHEASGDAGGKGCANAFETMVHKLAKQIILDADHITIPAFVAHYGQRQETVRQQQVVHITAAQDEVWLADIRRRPDVLVQAHRPLAIEIYVAHLCPKEKRDDFAVKELAAIEIDLSRYRSNLPDDFDAIVLTTANRAWLFHPTQAEADVALATKYAEIDRLAAERVARRVAAQDEATRVMKDRVAAWQAEEEAKRVKLAEGRARQEESDRLESLAMTEEEREAHAQRERQRLAELSEIKRRRAIAQGEAEAKLAAERAEIQRRVAVESLARADAADTSQRCQICSKSYSPFGFGLPPRRTMWACHDHRAEVDRLFAKPPRAASQPPGPAPAGGADQSPRP